MYSNIEANLVSRHTGTASPLYCREFLAEDFSKRYPILHAADIVDFLKLCRCRHPMEVVKTAPGADTKAFAKQHQRGEYETCFTYLRRQCGAGIKYTRS